MSKPAAAIRQFDSLFDLFDAFPDEQAAIDHLTAIRWKNGAYCPHCGSTRVMHFSDKKTHKCSDCRQRFSIKVGTIFEDTKLPLRKWFAAIWLITSHKTRHRQHATREGFEDHAEIGVVRPASPALRGPHEELQPPFSR